MDSGIFCVNIVTMPQAVRYEKIRVFPKVIAT
jgi:hypothetical protein